MRGRITRKQLFGGAAAASAGAVGSASVSEVGAAQRTTRDVWVAAVPAVWNMAPNGRDAIGGRELTPSRTVFQAVVYRRFTRGWGKVIPPDRVTQNGITGPLIRARVGETLRVHFKNMDTAFRRPHSMHFHGVHYREASDGAFIPGISGPGADVAVGESFTYVLEAEPDSVGTWPYHDHSPSMHDSIMGGLYGALVVDPAGARLPDREFLVFFAHHGDFATINGRAFIGNTPVFEARRGDDVRWHVLALGDEFHTFHIHGHRWRGDDGVVIDTRTVGPAESFAARFREDVRGHWLYHCHVETHMANGMIGLYRVR